MTASVFLPLWVYQAEEAYGSDFGEKLIDVS